VGGYNAANLQAAAQILQAAGLHNLGAGPGQPPHARALGMSAAAHILQQAGLGMPGLGAYAQHLALNPHAALLAAGAAGGGRGIGFGGRGGLMGPHSDMGPGGVAGGGRTGGRLSRRTTDPVAEAERKAQQVRPELGRQLAGSSKCRKSSGTSYCVQDACVI
jgi:protein phosphatase 1 regulatory subunit 42